MRAGPPLIRMRELAPYRRLPRRRGPHAARPVLEGAPGSEPGATKGATPQLSSGIGASRVSREVLRYAPAGAAVTQDEGGGTRPVEISAANDRSTAGARAQSGAGRGGFHAPGRGPSGSAAPWLRGTPAPRRRPHRADNKWKPPVAPPASRKSVPAPARSAKVATLLVVGHLAALLKALRTITDATP